MGLLKAPENTPVWINEDRCKACDLCVSVCPSGTLAMKFDEHKVLGKMAKVINPESCIGCQDCELHCPDFAIAVADRKEYKFAKLTDESKQRAQAIKENGYMAL
ncbi:MULTISPECIES: 4Fe-4S dicluster domain-containing protein [Helicobacter]|uniref:4Fe-4S binding protein n=1 Tax=Helicobacter ibis TaxID=2962633 RepID=A0ABT4VDL7_9HELI|nr:MULTISPECIES: 4Fe-4S binding protein [Helicobacter]MDA3966587.1 4Fe-4S binding protein [Helicobacter sp. WB40]MDA3968797.1 4Fe-4S binding protein [Helicobacter ibis]